MVNRSVSGRSTSAAVFDDATTPRLGGAAATSRTEEYSDRSATYVSLRCCSLGGKLARPGYLAAARQRRPLHSAARSIPERAVAAAASAGGGWQRCRQSQSDGSKRGSPGRDLASCELRCRRRTEPE
jgi:hypothetical protein